VQRGMLIGGRGGENEGTRGSSSCVERACFQCVESEAGARIVDIRVADLVRCPCHFHDVGSHKGKCGLHDSCCFKVIFSKERKNDGKQSGGDRFSVARDSSIFELRTASEMHLSDATDPHSAPGSTS